MTGFIDFAKAHGVLIDRLIPDGKIHRVPTAEHPTSRNGAYRFDGRFGWLMAWDSHDTIIRYEPTGPVDPVELERFRKRIDRDRAEAQRKAREAAGRARQIIGACSYGPHPYFGSKGLWNHQGLIDPTEIQFDRDDPTSREAGCLVVPMRHFKSGEVQSLQWIGRNGRKKYLPGGAAWDAVFAIGPQYGETWITEGYATGLSVVEALKHMYRTRDRVVVAFSAANLKNVATKLSGTRRIVADNDKPDSRGRRAGQEAAAATGLPWVCPDEEGSDANDLYAKKGAPGLAELLRRLL